MDIVVDAVSLLEVAVTVGEAAVNSLELLMVTPLEGVSVPELLSDKEEDSLRGVVREFEWVRVHVRVKLPVFESVPRVLDGDRDKVALCEELCETRGEVETVPVTEWLEDVVFV